MIEHFSLFSMLSELKDIPSKGKNGNASMQLAFFPAKVPHKSEKMQREY